MVSLSVMKFSLLKLVMNLDYVHFLIQSVPSYSSIQDGHYVKEYNRKGVIPSSSRDKRNVVGGKFWTSGYYVNTVGQYSNEEVIQA